MKIIEIEKCKDCPFLSHTGNYTKGGAKPCCNHPITVKNKGNDCFKRVIPYKTDYSDNKIFYTGVKVPKKIPNWCPLHDLKI